MIDKLIAKLTEAREDAVAAKMDLHFISELDHLVATAKANISEC